MRHDPPGKTHLGMRTHEVMSLMGRKITNVAEIVEFKEGHKIAFNVISGPLSAKGHRLVDKIEDQARFTYYVQAKLDGWINVFSPIVAWVFRRQVVSDLKRLKQILETSTV